MLMQVEWDYSELAKAYLKRPDYSNDAIDTIFTTANLDPSQLTICDIGAGVAHLTLKLAERGAKVTAVEPNDAMRELGIKRTRHLPNVNWVEGTGEDTTLEANQFDFVSFGSSFNVVDTNKALAEVKRICKPNAWFTCMWNHRDLKDEIQASIEAIIVGEINGYNYGARREDQTNKLVASNLFNEIKKIEGQIQHEMTTEEIIEAWRSHATLERQAGSKFQTIIEKIDAYLKRLKVPTIFVPYTTRVWLAQLAS